RDACLRDAELIAQTFFSQVLFAFSVDLLRGSGWANCMKRISFVLLALLVAQWIFAAENPPTLATPHAFVFDAGADVSASERDLVGIVCPLSSDMSGEEIKNVEAASQ